MADIAVSDVSYTEESNGVFSDMKIRRVLKLVFGDGALTYPTGGVPLSLAKLGFRTKIESFNIFDAANANGLIYKYDYANNKIRIYQGDNDAVADGPLVELAGGSATPAAATLYVEVVGY